mmetsp:Transcript_135445/g.235556  ORF Transcript_135445/g.235556 Transcript_135445/m.235556 type:complete len:263 (-) Transcript_135445:124-912(-)
MAFITGVGLETLLQDEEEEERRLALRAPPSHLDQLDLALLDAEPPSFGELLHNTVKMNSDDPLEELRRRIKRTRAKMDAQTQVLNGFITDVQQIRSLEKSFSSSSLSSPGAQRAALPAPSAHRVRAALGPPSAAALALPEPAARSRALATRTNTRSARPSSANATSPGLGSRAAAVRSSRPAGSLGQSQSQPSLSPSSVLGGLHQKTAALVMPQRRAPPGAAGNNTQKASALSAIRRRAAPGAGSFSEESLASRRHTSLSRR